MNAQGRYVECNVLIYTIVRWYSVVHKYVTYNQCHSDTVRA